MQEVVEKLSSFIKDPALERLDLTLSKPNIFEILRISRTELRHSNFLAWMLNPAESHRLDDTFLKWFLKEVFSDQRVDWINEFKVDSLDNRSLIVHREFRHIDLLLETPNFVVVIENKFDSKEHSNQLSRYKEVVEREFPEKNHAFVFLTPHANSPEQDDDKNVYVTFSYGAIVRILESIIETYGHSMSVTIATYINDYVAVLRRHVLQEDAVIDIAREIYKNHKDALDFIFEHKPDRVNEVAPYIQKAVKSKGYILGSLDKYFVRFLTPALNEALPKSVMAGWKGKEPFLFELAYWEKKLFLKCTVSPNKAENRNMLIAALKTIEGAKAANGKQWSITHSHRHNFDIEDEKFDDLEEVQTFIEFVLDKERSFIQKIESVILKHCSAILE